MHRTQLGAFYGKHCQQQTAGAMQRHFTDTSQASKELQAGMHQGYKGTLHYPLEVLELYTATKQPQSPSLLFPKHTSQRSTGAGCWQGGFSTALFFTHGRHSRTGCSQLKAVTETRRLEDERGRPRESTPPRPDSSPETPD